ncbi:hypothetical protein Tco_1208424, partial [Tanacetum coccineum]
FHADEGALIDKQDMDMISMEVIRRYHRYYGKDA